MRVLAGLIGVLSVWGQSQPSGWRLTRSEHFEVYSQAGDETAHAALAWFEQLRAFLEQQSRLKFDDLSPVRVIAFRSAKEYQPYRLRASSDAYYVGTESRDYIVMAGLDAGAFRIAAHEYAHSILHAAKFDLPVWLSEGLAELFSTVRVGEHVSSLGGDLPAHTQLLRRHSWIPLAELMAFSPQEDRESATLFYAQSWALTEMLVLSPEYGPRFPALIAALTSGVPGSQALTTVYGKSLDGIAHDVRTSSDRSRARLVSLPGVVTGGVAIRVSAVPSFELRSLLADLLFAAGELDRAETLYRDLARESPADADVAAALGAIAFRKGDAEGARREWKRAVELGIRDATLCYRYAMLAFDAGATVDEVRPVFERALALKPDFDDARFHLALLEKNSGRYEAAVVQFQAMKNVAPVRAYSYWIGLADALNELGRREEAIAAAGTAKERARTAQERAHADQIAYFAQTDLAVQFTRDASGRQQLVTARAPHDATDWNSFIEPGDDIRRVQGTLREIECGDAGTRIVVDTPEGLLRLTIPDPSRVLMRNAPSEFTCGPQAASAVKIDFAASKTQRGVADGVVRGIEFR